MDLHGIDTVMQPRERRELPVLTKNDALLAGGTFIFSEPQRGLRRLIDLTALRWPAIETYDAGLSIGATCTFAELYAYAADAPFAASPLFGQCCRSLWGSFKIWNTATIGGNLCLALPASPMAALAVALDGVCTIWCLDGTDRTVAAADFITGPGRTCLEQGEILRQILLPGCALRRSYEFRQASLTDEGRSAALLAGCTSDGGFALTITAATRRPINISFTSMPDADALLDRLDAEVAQAGSWYDDVHGAPDWRRHMTRRYARDIHRVLCGS